MHWQGVKVLLQWSLLLAVSCAGQIQRKYVTAFMNNPPGKSKAVFQLYLVTSDKPATVTVTVPQPFFNKTVHVDKDSSGLVTLDNTYMITEKDVTSKVISVTSDEAISVIAFNTEKVTADAMTCLPEEDLGTEYYVIIPGQVTGSGKQIVVANGFEDKVQVTITVSGSITYNGISYQSGETFSVFLENQQVIQFQSSEDPTGSKISSTSPVAVFAGHSCFTGLSSYCDILMEQLHPVKNWGTVFPVFPFLTNTQDVISIVAGSPDTFVTIYSPKGTTQHSLHEGGHVQVTVDNILLINATKPVTVSYLFQQSRSDSLQYQYDPSAITVPPLLPGGRYYKFVTQSYYDNFILIVSQTSSDSGFYLDGKPLSSYPMTMKEFNGFRGWQVTLGKTEGQHKIHHVTSPFILYVFGTEVSVSYGYSLVQGLPFPEPTKELKCSIHCLKDAAEFILPYSLVSAAHLDALHIHLKDSMCRAENMGDHYLIKIPFTRCGSSVLYDNGRTFYANTIYGTIPDTDVHRIEIPVRCEMENNKSVELIINPKVNNMVCKSYYNVSMKLYESDSFTEPLTLYPHKVDLNSNLHLELEVLSNDEELQIFTETLTASPSLGDTKKIYRIIERGCHQDSTLQVHQMTDPRLQRFSFHAVKFDQFNEVYLTANVIICHNSTSPNRCTRGCISSRLRRDVPKEEVDTARLSQGPIVFSSDEKITQVSVLASGLVVALCTTVILSILALVIQKEYYRRKKRALPPSNDL
ncbi:IgGFc-binding protein-like [Engystomops pustulosus]|uniref:IgGFc-binding protein-like n=1 Tax=Engystomops pustulosus TaxID=76066 RepID=UPI003AFA039A